ncbi:hypothetical protein [Alkalilimnicola sp. S0819]|uniref:hypothetical protein n=1 Tax=Alkalilimnicola sp. S0819 TaxID=2613922 RepID=UPI0012619D98|nr:hypothetical protein [Alkalilimnicola sp. S0819]KAB7624450.1 hypothetical protein F3N43_06505 [Alkalilimnicola sp. S0819]MPQ16284.1 hypothetical protein [Alkalilimnicola sp. S0819]
MEALRERIIRAQGGRQALSGVGEVMGRAAFGGWEFSARFCASVPRDVDFLLLPGSAEVAFSDFPAATQTAWFGPRGTRIENAAGVCLAEREAPGAVLRSVGHWFAWDTLDAVYYCGLALWHALAPPFLLMREELDAEVLPECEVAGKRLQRLRLCATDAAMLPAGDLLLYADASGLLQRLDCSSPCAGGWPRMAQLCEGHEAVERAVLATRRRFHGCFGGQRQWPLMPLAWLELDDLGLARSRPAG